jgi:hypothetical protein
VVTIALFIVAMGVLFFTNAFARIASLFHSSCRSRTGVQVNRTPGRTSSTSRSGRLDPVAPGQDAGHRRLEVVVSDAARRAAQLLEGDGMKEMTPATKAIPRLSSMSLQLR